MNQDFLHQETTIGAWLDKWFEVYTGDLAAKTIATYQDARRRLCVSFPDIEQTALYDLLPVSFQTILNQLGSRYSQSTIRHIKVLYSKMYEAAIKNGLCEINPAKVAVIPRYASLKKVDAMTRAQQEAFEKAASQLPVMDHFALMTFLLTGLRRDELRNLRWEDWDQTHKVLHVRASKTENGIRDIPLIPEVTIMFIHIKHLNEGQQCPYIFSLDGKIMARGHLRYICAKTARIAHIPHVTPHILRHSFATRMIEQGADPKSLSTIIGHANVAFTLQRYVTVDKQHLADQMMLLSRTSQK